MTMQNMNNTNTEVNVININTIINHNGKAGKLLQSIGAACENAESLSVILALEKELDELKAARPDYEYIPTMEEWITEAKRFLDCENCREDLEAIFKIKGADDYTAKNAADEIIWAWHMQDNKAARA